VDLNARFSARDSKVDESCESALAEFFRVLVATGDNQHFHPHPLTEEEARRRARYTGLDLYYVLLERREVLGYGMLRGWDEGFEVPSLGIAIHPSARRTGLGELLMRFLHTAARRRGARRIRLKTYVDNKSALELYLKLGYAFQQEEAGQIVGMLNLWEEPRNNDGQALILGVEEMFGPTV